MHPMLLELGADLRTPLLRLLRRGVWWQLYDYATFVYTTSPTP